jgi:hypothetical protein
MPLTVPNLDDRTYDDLVEEALGMLPRYAPSWTNHNASDPGITIVELLAYFVELFIYRLNRLSRETRLRFLQLLVGAEPPDGTAWAALSTEDIDRRLRHAVRDLAHTQRAVTAEDYEHHAREAGIAPPAQVVRAKSFARRNLEAVGEGGRDRDAPGHLSVIGVPPDGAPRDAVRTMLEQLREHLEPMKLIATRLHVVEPFFLRVRIMARIHMREDAGDELRGRAREDALRALQEFGSPMTGGGPQGEGWPFGRALYLSEVYERLEQMDGVDFVDDVDVVEIALREGVTDERARIGLRVGRSLVGVDTWLGARPEHGPERILVEAAGRMVGVALKPYELLRVTSSVEDFSTGEGGARRPRVERGRRAPAGPPGPTPGTRLEPGEPPVGVTGRPSDSIARRPATGDRRAAGDGAPGRLLAQLPGIYHPSSDLSQLLSTFETILCEPHPGALETQIAQIATLFDVVRAPHELPGWISAQAPGVLSQRRDAFLPWLAQWVALSGAASLPIERQRRLVGRIVPLYACRGTRRYLIELLRFHLPEHSEIGVEDQDFTGLILGKSRIGVDAWLEEDRPFWFKVTIRLPDGGAAHGRVDWPARIRQVVDLAKPAHTTYDLEMVPSRGSE